MSEGPLIHAGKRDGHGGGTPLLQPRERATVIQEELTKRLADMMNQKLYVLSVAAAIFLPLNLFAGMLGMTVAGVPGLKTRRPAPSLPSCSLPSVSWSMR